MDTDLQISSIKAREILASDDSSARLVFITTLPHTELPCPLCRLYDDMAWSCKRFCIQELMPQLKRITEEEKAPVEWSYRLNVVPTITPEGVTVTLSASLTDKTHRRTLAKSTLTHNWDSKGRTILRQKPQREERVQSKSI